MNTHIEQVDGKYRWVCSEGHVGKWHTSMRQAQTGANGHKRDYMAIYQKLPTRTNKRKGLT